MVYVELPEEYRQPDVIREALAGRSDRLSAPLALSLLSESGIDLPERVGILHEIVSDRDVEARFRTVAVVGLQSLPPDSAIPELVAILEQVDIEDVVASRAAIALGRIGSPDHVDLLNRVHQTSESPLVRERALFAAALIIHRFGLTGVEFHIPAVERQTPPDRARATTFVSRTLGLPTRNDVLAGIRRSLPFIDAARHRVHEILCEDRPLAVALRTDLEDPHAAGELVSAPAVLGAVAFRDEEHSSYYAGLIVLSSPVKEDAVSIVAARSTGQAVYVGDGLVGPSGLEVQLESAAAPGVTAVQVTGRTARTGHFEITGISSRQALRGRVPVRADDSLS